MQTISFPLSQIDGQSAEIISQRVETIIKSKGKCLLALSGGTTPKELYEHLALLLPAQQVEIVLVDERVVAPQSSFHNGSFIKKCFNNFPLQEKVMMFVTEGEEWFEQSQLLFDDLEYIDLAILGIGDDGHTASLFDRQDLLKEGRLVQTSKEGENFMRISLGHQELMRAAQIIFFVKGEHKKNILLQLQHPQDALKYPAGHLLWNHPDALLISSQ